MIGSSSRALLALLLGTSAAWAATPAAQPHVIAPSLRDDSVEEDDDPRAGPERETSAPAPLETIRETTITGSPVEGFGTLDQSREGLPQDSWRGSSRETIDAYLSELRGGADSPALQSLLTRLLLTQAAPPQGSGSQSWFAARVYALIAIGQDEKAEAMLASLPNSMISPPLRKLQTELKLLRGEYDQACRGLDPESFPADDGEAFWPKLMILCKARAGKQDEAMVGVDLMREQQHADDLFFHDTIRRVGDRNAPIKSAPKNWSALNIALLRLSGDAGMIKDRMDAFPPIVLKYLARDTTLDVKLREKATARAQQSGILPESAGNRTQEPPFSRALASDVTTLVAALGSSKPANAADNAVIARLALSDASISDSRRVQRLLTLMEPFGYRVPPEVWHQLYPRRERFDGDMPPASLVARLQDAAQASRRGETIVLASLVASGGDIGKTPDLALLPVIRSLQSTGFEKEARAVAYDAVKSYSGR